MPNITLQNRIIINSSSCNQNETFLLESAKPIIQNMIQSLWAINPPMNFNDFKITYPQRMQVINKELTEMASFYLKNIRPRLPHIMDRHQILWPILEAEVINFELKNPDSLEIVVYFFSQQYRLVDSFGHFLLLTQIGEKESSSLETFTIQLTSELSVHTYDI